MALLYNALRIRKIARKCQKVARTSLPCLYFGSKLELIFGNPNLEAGESTEASDSISLTAKADSVKQKFNLLNCAKQARSGRFEWKLSSSDEFLRQLSFLIAVCGLKSKEHRCESQLAI